MITRKVNLQFLDNCFLELFVFTICTIAIRRGLTIDVQFILHQNEDHDEKDPTNGPWSFLHFDFDFVNILTLVISPISHYVSVEENNSFSEDALGILMFAYRPNNPCLLQSLYQCISA